MLWALIMAGGRGTRLWPISHQESPKPFLRLIPGRKTLYEETLKRLQPLISKKHIWVIGNQDHLGLIRKHSKGIPKNQLIGEPMARNTAPTVALAAKEIFKLDPNAVLVVLPADHWIRDHKKFKRALNQAYRFAKQNQSFVIFGIKPTFPSTSYGYLNQGRKIAGSISQLNRFVEKPDLKRAKTFLNAGNYFWHAGIFMAPVSVILKELNQRCGPLMERAETVKIQKNIFSSKSAFQKLPDISIDYAVLEKLSKAHMIAGNFDWCDVGTWSSFQGLWPSDKFKNTSFGPSLSLEASGNTIYSKNKPVCLFNVHDLVVVDSPQAILVTHKNCGESLRHLVKAFHDHKKKHKRA